MAILTEKELKVYLLALGGLTLAALVITILVMALKGDGDVSSAGEGPAVQEYVPADATRFLNPEVDVLDKVRIPEEYTRLYEKDWKPFRPMYERWTQTMTAPYWIDPQTLVREEMEKQSDREIMQFFEDVP